MAWGYPATTLLILIFLAATLYDTSDITQLTKSFIASATLDIRGFSLAFLGKKDFSMARGTAPLDNLGEEVSLSPNVYPYRYSLRNYWSFVPALVNLNARDSVCPWTGI
jgi:hypothetical protein